MSETDTSAEAVERIASMHEAGAAMMRRVAKSMPDDAVAAVAGVRQDAEDTAATLRALRAERDAAIAVKDAAIAFQDRFAAERDAARAEAARLREAAEALLADVYRRHPGEDLRCAHMRSLAAALAGEPQR